MQAQPTEGTLEAREGALAEATDLTLTVAGAVRSYANPLDLPELRAAVKVNYSSFTKMRRVARMDLAQRIYDAALPIVAHLAPYGITAATLEELQTSINEATDAVSAPRTTNAEKKVATSKLDDTCRAIDDLLKNEIDPLIFGLRKKNPDVYRLYQEARQVFDRPGGRPADPEPATPATPTTASTTTTTTVPSTGATS